MLATRQLTLIGSVVPLWGLLLGCASVDPTSDYERARQNVARATGHESMYLPGQSDAVSDRVESLLSNGLTAEEGVQVALLNNPDLQAAWMNLGMARADFVQAGLLSNPSLGGSLRFPSGGGLANLELTIAQNIADIWRIPARQRTAQAAIEREILDFARQAAGLAADARTAYYRAVGANGLQEVAKENLVITEQLLDLAIGRQNAGAGAELEVNLSRSAVLEARLAVESARLAAAEAKRTLARFLGISSDPETLVLVEQLPDSRDFRLQVDQVIEHAQRTRLDVRAADLAVTQAESELKAEYLEVWPSLELGVDMERGERKSGQDEGTDFSIGPGWNLELPIFDQNQAQIAKAGYALEQARKQLESLRRSATLEVRGACDRLTTAWSIAGLYRDQFIPLASKNLELSRDSYNAGRASFLAVLEAQRFYLDTRRRSIEALQTAAGAIPELERVTATPIAELLSMLAGSSAQGRPTSRPSVKADARMEIQP